MAEYPADQFLRCQQFTYRNFGFRFVLKPEFKVLILFIIILNIYIKIRSARLSNIDQSVFSAYTVPHLDGK
jgi:hypothetical protein